MWFAVIVFVCLSVEILSYLTGGDTKNGIKGNNEEKTSPEALQGASGGVKKVKYGEPQRLVGLTTARGRKCYFTFTVSTGCCCTVSKGDA